MYVPSLNYIRVTPTLLLDGFINKGFKTKVELHNRSSTGVAIAGILIALLASLGSIVLNIRSDNKSTQNTTNQKTFYSSETDRILSSLNSSSDIFKKLSEIKDQTELINQESTDENKELLKKLDDLVKLNNEMIKKIEELNKQTVVIDNKSGK